MKFLFLPFSWIYGLVTWIRNKLYDRHILKTYKSPLKTVVVGNLQVGGSGKTPLTAYLYKWLSSHYKCAILSRGYGRRTKGLLEAGPGVDAWTIGDEPYWYFKHLKDARIVVSEKRKLGLKYLETKDSSLVLLDDAFQHRAVKGDISIVLSEYAKPYYNDYPLPFGRMREYRTGDKRADIIMMTKCPPKLSLQEKVEIIQHINPLDHQHIFFTTVVKGRVYPLRGATPFENIVYSHIIALSAIANPDSFELMCREYSHNITKLSYRDHYEYSETDVERFKRMLDDDTVIICTEKDAVKLEPYLSLIPENKFFVLPIEIEFLFHEEAKFRKLVMDLLR